MRSNSNKPVPTLIDEDGRIVSSDQDTYVDTTYKLHQASRRFKWLDRTMILFMLLIGTPLVFYLTRGALSVNEMNQPIPTSLAATHQFYHSLPNSVPDLKATDIGSGVHPESTSEILQLDSTVSHASWINGDTQWIHTVSSGIPLCFDKPVRTREKIAYVSTSYQNPRYGTLYISSANGNYACRLTPYNVMYDSAIDWTSDGEQIAFSTDWSDDMRTGIFSLSQNDPVPRLLTSDCVLASQPDWSPSGMKLLFTGNCGSQYGIFIFHSEETGDQPNLQYIGEGDYPKWSPDERQIAFTRMRGGNVDGHYIDLFIMDTNGTNVVRLTTTQALETTLSWSPDGGFIVFTLVRPDTGNDLVIVNVETGELTTLWAEKANDRDPIWLDKGRIAFLSNWLLPNMARYQAIFITDPFSSTVIRHSEYMEIGAFDWYTHS